MVRDTSLETYYKIKRNGLLSKRRFEVYDCIYQFGPCTATYVFGKLKLKTNQSGRFTELEEAGVIKDVGTTICDETKMTVTLWDVTSNLPQEIPKKVSRSERVERIKQSIKPFVPQPERSRIYRALDRLK